MPVSGRDYTTKPMQANGRSAFDYGNTKLSRDRGVTIYVEHIAIAAVFGLALVFGAWGFFA